MLLHRKCPPHAGQVPSLSSSPVMPVGLSALFGASAPQWASTPSPQFGQSAPLLANDAVLQSCLTIRTPRPAFARRALSCALCHSSFPRPTKVLWVGPSAADCPP